MPATALSHRVRVLAAPGARHPAPRAPQALKRPRATGPRRPAAHRPPGAPTDYDVRIVHIAQGM
ncbi:hypothetical protein C0Q93_01680 [Streptomyces albidoflavus]|nr:hypothetical protein C0Q93_01680 [Streptomyces albidoflavus]RZE53587.1 hypothetical protein C0Q94_01680 [Streptomyces albidoflavus]